MSKLRARIQWAGLFLGPLLALAVYALLPGEYPDAEGKTVVFEQAGRVVLGGMIWMAIWWLTEAVEVTTTALLPLVLFPLAGAATMKEAAAPYANHLIFLFMGGFIIALSMQRWGLDRRIALATLRLVGTRPANMVGGFMLATAGLSAFISNTATTAMMLPIAISVVALLKQNSGDGAEAGESKAGSGFGVCLMLGIAYAATLGGLCTLIGTPPNVFFRGFIEDGISDAYQMEIGFYSWLKLGLPVTLTMLPLTWLLLTRWLFPIERKRIPGAAVLIHTEWAKLGSMNRGERITLFVFLLTAMCWILRGWLSGIAIPWGEGEVHPFAGLSDPGIAMTAALLLFVLPVSVPKREFTMNWKTAKKLPWEILVLFGGGMSLAAGVKLTGVAEFLGSQAGNFAGMPPFVIILVVAASVILLTELTSNLATTATLLPVLAALAPGLGLHPYLLIFPATIAASCAFMMPVATPPNAIVFGSGEIALPQMMKAGVWLNLLGLIVIMVVSWFRLESAIGVKLFGE
ncbi:MAG: sodium-dependent dicarboxylate transporter 2/3/5 [Candidatus Binatia bacterium]|jgi:sodium-dependent dicarboxylate transporter 2/3/5